MNSSPGKSIFGFIAYPWRCKHAAWISTPPPSYILIVLTLFFISRALMGQSDPDTVLLSGIEVKGLNANSGAGRSMSIIDTVLIQSQGHKDLGSLLSLSSPVFVKAYGQGGISTASFRGSSAQHTSVSWNGIQLNSPMLGQTNLGNIPVSISEEIQIQYGGAAEAGVYSLPGANISLSSIPFYHPENSLKLSLMSGSFHTKGIDLQGKAGGKKWGITLGFYSHASKNDFPFVNNALTNYQMESRTHAAWDRHGIVQHLHWKVKPKLTISLHSWWQRSWSELPPPLLVFLTERNESLGEWTGGNSLIFRGRLRSWNWRSTTAFLFHETDFTQRIAGKRSISSSKSYQQQWVISKTFSKRMQVESLANLVYDEVNSPHYAADVHRSQAALAGRIDARPWNWMNTSVGINYIASQGHSPGLLPSIGLDIIPWPKTNLQLKAYHGLAKRFPTLNERYWVPGGNGGLQPEQGRITEAGLHFSRRASENSLDVSFGYFDLNIKEWIQWVPEGLSHFWTPVNLKHVHSSGIETSWRYQHRIHNHALSLRSSVYYTSAREQRKIKEEEKQLIYIPLFMGNLSTVWQYRQWEASLQSYYTGRRYTRVDESAYMPSHLLFDANLGYRFDRPGHGISLNLLIQNLSNTNYQVVAWHPMPRRSLEISIRIHLTQKKHK